MILYYDYRSISDGRSEATIRSTKRQHSEESRHVLYKLWHHDNHYLEKKHERRNGVQRLWIVL